MISNGAYTLAEWVPNGRIKLVKNPIFYDAVNVKIEEVYFYPTYDTQAALKRVRAGELDMQVNFPAGQIDWLKQYMPEWVQLFPFLNVAYVVFNVKNKPFDDVRVREALSLGMNRELINDSIFKLGEPAAYSFVPPGTANYPSTAALAFKGMAVEERKARAKQLLAEAGFGPDNPLTFKFKTMVDPDLKRSAVAIQQMWSELGARVQIENNEPKVHYTAILQQHTFDVAYAGWVADYNDADNFLFMLESDNAGFNYGQWFDSEYDALMARAYQSKDLIERGQILSQAEQLMLDHHALAPMRLPYSRYLVGPHVKGFEPNLRRVFRTRWLSVEGQRVAFDQSGGTTQSGETGSVQTERSWAEWFCASFGIWCSA
jgi:oligopeptide transport system substrate-binding protein